MQHSAGKRLRAGGEIRQVQAYRVYYSGGCLCGRRLVDRIIGTDIAHGRVGWAPRILRAGMPPVGHPVAEHHHNTDDGRGTPVGSG